MSAIISAFDLVKFYRGRRVLHGVSLSAGPGHRLGLIGENGVGKSTLLRILAGVEDPDAGTVDRSGGEQVGFLHQEPPYPADCPIGQVLEQALAPYRAAAARLEQLGERLQHNPDDHAAVSAYGQVLTWAIDHDLWDADRRAQLVLAGLGLGEVDHQRRVGSLSGGERSRLGMAVLLIQQPRVLLLDEPTNHLDEPALEFLQTHLASLPGAVVVASHDRVFLDAVCTGLLDLDPAQDGPVYYGGGYTDYLRHKITQRRAWQQQYEQEQAELARLRHAVAAAARQVAPARAPRDGNKMAYGRHADRVQAQVSRRVRDAQRRLADLTRRQVRKPPAPLRFHAALTRAATDDGTVVSLRHVRLPGRLEVDHLDVPASGKLLVVGGNGAGKSTLLAVLAGRLTPTVGTVTHRRRLRVGLLEQQVTFSAADRTPQQVYAEAAPDGPPLQELGLLPPATMDRPVGTLSVGQRRRLALALLLATPPDLLLLDEPTNHLSLSLVEELEQALARAPGAVVVASHDRWLRRRWQGLCVTIGADHRVGTVTGTVALSNPARSEVDT